MNGPQVYKLFTLALGAAMELHRMLNGALEDHLLPQANSQ